MKCSLHRFGEITINYDKKRVPLSSMERAKRKGQYRYYGAQGVIDYIDDYIFDGTFLLIAEDGENLKSNKQKIAQIVSGQFWVNNHAHIVQVNDLCNVRFLCYLLNTMDLSGYITGSAQPKLSQANLNAVEMKIPERNLQDKIVSVLSILDDKIENNNAINKNLEEQAQAIFDSFYEKAETEVDFTSIIQVLGGGTPKTSVESYWNGDIPFFTPKDVGNPYTLSTEKSITSSGLENCNSRLYPVNTIFVTARGTVGKVSLAGVPMAMNQSCYALIGKEIPPILVYFYTLKTVQSLRHKASGAVFDAIITSDFKTETLREISDFDSKRLLNMVAPMMDKILQGSIENARLAKLRDALLPRLMSGELDVSGIVI